jgi:OmcA/MtrC family decaheme c-type cytochrome
MTPHSGGPQADDSQCVVCHPPVGGLAGVVGVHLLPLYDPTVPTFTLSIVGVSNTAPGQTPEVVFTAQQNGAPLDLLGNPLPVLAVTMAGPTTEYASYVQYAIQGDGGVGTLTSDPQGYRYTFPAPMPDTATGTYAFALEGTIQPSGPTGPQVAAMNPIAYGAVTDPSPVPRRTIVNVNQCNSCHYQLDAHGGLRPEVQYCSFCHNANKANDQLVPLLEGQAATAQSVHLPVMVHKIHAGYLLTQQPYVLGAYPGPSPSNPSGTSVNFGTVRFPPYQGDCWACHAGQSYVLPLTVSALPSASETLICDDAPDADANGYCNHRVVTSTTYTPPTTAACTGCHDAPYVVAHAQSNTVNGAEACATCHGVGTAYDAQTVHLPAP